MNQQLMKQKIIAYINAAYQWHETGNGSLIEEGVGRDMSYLEEEILTGFGLPFMAFQYSEILQLEGFSIENIEERASELIKELAREASSFLLSPIEKDEDILNKAKQHLQDAVEVLPIIGISTSHYNLFLYYDCYFRNLLTETALISHLKKSEILDEHVSTRIPYTYAALANGKQMKRLIDYGLPFIKQYKNYLQYISGNKPWNEFIFKSKYNGQFSDKMIITLKHFYLSAITIFKADCAVIELLVKYKGFFEPILVSCTSTEMKLIMLHARYYTLAIPPLHITKPEYLTASSRHIRIKDANGHNVEISKINIGIKRIENREYNTDTIQEFTIDFIKASDKVYAIVEFPLDHDLPF